MARYIDIEGFEKLFDKEYKATRKLIYEGETHLDNIAEGFSEAAKVIRAIPTADVVEVVRCKDCKRRYSDMCAMWIDCDCCGAHADWCNDNDYCSWGERR